MIVASPVREAELKVNAAEIALKRAEQNLIGLTFENSKFTVKLDEKHQCVVFDGWAAFSGHEIVPLIVTEKTQYTRCKFLSVCLLITARVCFAYRTGLLRLPHGSASLTALKNCSHDLFERSRRALSQKEPVCAVRQVGSRPRRREKDCSRNCRFAIKIRLPLSIERDLVCTHCAAAGAGAARRTARQIVWLLSRSLFFFALFDGFAGVCWVVVVCVAVRSGIIDLV